ncbi:Putative flippase GtrA (transmembrane translocase of bactoprenol-linked glucose) [Actinoplanes derwentensis]|uniref:Putative flippase GtrA (Transmembrane translocase of bactoprenol-linked glucose) n=1 Tax=Actinoplanes derwentensis TaxID=113562 RepID=A0A1H2D167_9ACTN|nr:membrane protein [Actinoplanes derwentensis]SDT76508.1 Putative flippase GtrA (transmembrane translocase of bactoprenol-linked glucose) [Actinoplanes derwentensis]
MTGTGTLGSVPPNPDLRSRLRGLVSELGKFGAVGGFAFTVDLVLYNLLLQQGIETLIAKTVSTTVATTIAFFGNRFWTWRDDGDHVSMTRQYTTFFVLNLIGLGIALACLAISHYGLGSVWAPARSRLADNIAGLGVGTALGTLFRFWSYRRYVFRVNVAPAAQSPASQ